MEQKQINKIERTKSKTFRGTAVSNKMNKTVTVGVQRKFWHPLYRNQVISNKKYHAADQNQFVLLIML